VFTSMIPTNLAIPTSERSHRGAEARARRSRLCAVFVGFGLLALRAAVADEILPPTKGTDDVCHAGSLAGVACGQHSDCPGGYLAYCHLKNRFITVELPTTATSHGVKVTLVGLDTNSVATPADYNGTDRWLGAPSLDIADGIWPPFNAAKVQCSFFSQDWSAVGRIHIYGDVIVPRSTYDVSVCNPQATCSSAVPVDTARFGKIVTQTTSVSYPDITALVARFRGLPFGPSKTRTKLREPVDPKAPLNFGEVSAGIAAFQAKTYRLVVPAPPVVCP